MLVAKHPVQSFRHPYLTHMLLVELSYSMHRFEEKHKLVVWAMIHGLVMDEVHGKEGE